MGQRGSHKFPIFYSVNLSSLSENILYEV